MEGDYISNLEYCVRKWVLNKYHYLNLDESDITVDFDDVVFSCKKPDFSNVKRSEIEEPNVVFTSTFNNKTDTTHESRFTIKRSTSAIGKIVLRHGFKADHIFGAQIQTPPMAQSIFKGVTNIDLKESNKMEETMNWTFTSLVRAAPHRRTDTHFEVKEEKLTADFTTYVVMKGPVKIDVKVNPTGPPERITKSVATILDEVLVRAPRNPNSIFLNRNRDSADWPFRGQMSFQYGITQNERVE